MSSDHDIRYKKLFSNPVLVQQLIESFVEEPWTKELDFSTLERLDKSFVTDEFKEKESDIIYKINFRDKTIYIYLLIEFQSKPDRFMALKMLRYTTEFYQYLIQSCKIKFLPAVFPVLLYNGERKWRSPLNIQDLIERTIPDKYIPEYSYYKIAENEFSKDTLKKIKNLISAVFYVENFNVNDNIAEINEIITLIRNEKLEELNLFKKWIKNYFHGIETAITDETSTRINELVEVRDMFAETLKKRDKLQFNKGLTKGILETSLKTAKNLLLEGMPVEKISSITGLPVEKIRGLK